jgi:ABC-type Zn uptake system ZnuABC Zn-binding protein ZnuA
LFVRSPLALVTVVALALSACAPGASSPTVDLGASPTVADASPTPEPPVLRVVAALAPIADLVRQVGGGLVDVTSMVPAGADAHTYEPRPRDVVGLADADLYVGIGLSLNDGVLRLAQENLREGASLVLLGEVALADDDLVFDHAHDHDDGHGHTHSHGDNGHSHSHGDPDDEPGPNPHVWTSLRNTMSLVEGIAEALSAADPEHAGDYRERAADYIAELEALDRRIAAAIATIPDDNRMLVVYHDAWTYFARDYGLDMITAVQPADFSEPSASEVRAIIDLIRELGVTVVFGSEVFPTPVLEAIAEETGARYVADLSDDALPGAPGSADHTYLELMRRNARAVVDGLGGDARLLDD